MTLSAMPASLGGSAAIGVGGPHAPCPVRKGVSLGEGACR